MCKELSELPLPVKHAVSMACVDCLKIREEDRERQAVDPTYRKRPSWWLHLRTCQTDGLTRCCDNSPNRHATKHAGPEHPVVVSAEPNDNWAYCYLHEEFAHGPQYNAHPIG